jgi:HEAT repeat protein
MNEQVREVWTAACESFRRACTDEDLLRLRGARHDPDQDTRARVIEALALIRDDTVIPDLQEALRDPEDEVRVVAAEGLQKLGEILFGEALDGLTTAVRIAPST